MTFVSVGFTFSMDGCSWPFARTQHLNFGAQYERCCSRSKNLPIAEPILGSAKIGDVKRAIPTRYSFGSVDFTAYLVSP